MSPTPGNLALTGFGALLVWSALRGAGISASLKDVVTGHEPSGANANPIVDTPAAGNGSGGTISSGGYTTSSAIANDFMQYVGKVPYRWGGANPRGWDCSGSLNYVLCHDLGVAIPGYKGGTFTGSVHGPVTGQWLIWPGAVTIPAGNVQPGDLCCWPTHIGVAVDSQHYVSAIDTQYGTGVQRIHGGGPGGELVTFRRLKAAIAPGEAGIPHKR